MNQKLRKQINYPVDWVIQTEEGSLMVEYQRNNQGLAQRQQLLQMYVQKIAVEFVKNEGLRQKQQTEDDISDYKVIGKYKVKETFAGDASLTELLTQYVERTVSLRF